MGRAADGAGAAVVSPPRTATAARVSGVVLACLAVLAGFNAAYVVAYAVRERSAGAAAAALACVAVTAALAWAAARVWRR